MMLTMTVNRIQSDNKQTLTPDRPDCSWAQSYNSYSVLSFVGFVLLFSAHWFFLSHLSIKTEVPQVNKNFTSHTGFLLVWLVFKNVEAQTGETNNLSWTTTSLPLFSRHALKTSLMKIQVPRPWLNGYHTGSIVTITREKQCFTGPEKATRSYQTHCWEKNKNRGADSISARRDHGARRCCGVRGVPCDDLFPQSEPAPLAVFGPTLHSSAAQLYHTPLP